MKYYNPDKPLNVSEWLVLDDEQRKILVSNFHESIEEFQDDGALTMHSYMHVVVENQIAKNVDLVSETVTKLVRQGLSRHEALHAISAIIVEDIFDMLKDTKSEFCLKKYRRKLEKITAKRWRKGQY
ncbi:hypothetical protein J7438_09290 [Thalassotalea sp. G20_0]|uniref:hypothetical protein n=1 Tax=Thalassotalea sp. G20_0 TaxID=2821093 RepID=UPI001ADC6FE6|nr:hypothetical protein [Thalassotalea sp. G20_0]MBO9494277.1 hypothetical protein [Thalassotalea sp. G20_0]